MVTNLNLYALAQEDLNRYAASRQARPGVISPGVDVLQRRAQLLNAPQAAQAAMLGGYQASTVPVTEAQDADEARWRAWWGISPAITYERLHGLGAAGQAAFELAQKLKKLGVGSGGGGGGGGGGGRGGSGGGGAPLPPQQGWTGASIAQPNPAGTQTTYPSQGGPSQGTTNAFRGYPGYDRRPSSRSGARSFPKVERR